MRYWIKTYTSAFMLLFVWQLFVLFYAPFISTQEPSNDARTETICFAGIEQMEEETAITDGQTNVFVEEILEEEIHPSDTLEVKYSKDLVFHFAFHKLSDYHASIKSHFLPPEAII